MLNNLRHVSLNKHPKHRDSKQQGNKQQGNKTSSLKLLLTSALMLASLSATAATVSVSNYPLFLLSEAVTQGAPSAKQIMQAGEVGHHASLSPSDMKTIKDSKFVVWFGEPLEHGLAHSLEDAPNDIALLDFDAFTRHPLRDVQAQPIAGSEDPHIWLDPENAKAIVRALAVIHSYANPEHEALYQANAQKFAQRMDDAVITVTTQYQLSNAQSSNAQTPQPLNRPYWAYHDAFQYIETALGAKLVGTLTTDHHLPPKASQIQWLNSHRPQNTMCMVLQGSADSGLTQKLSPLNTTVQLEDMSNATDFVTGWTQMAEQIYQCIDGA